MNTKQLHKIAFFDLETTSANPSECRIVQIAAVLTDMDFNPITEVISTLVNPQVPIPASATEIHGITDEMVAKAPLLIDVAPGLLAFIAECHLGGYSVKFDIQVLLNEFERLGIEFDLSGLMIIDPFVTLRVMEPRDQSTVYEYYTGEKLKDAHNAASDIFATVRIAQEQKKKYESINTPEDMWMLSEPQNQCDLAGKIKMKDGIPVFNFGKHFDNPISENKGYLSWMLTADMPMETKKWIENYLKREGEQNG